MTDKEYNTQKRRVKAAFAKWSGPTGMGDWIVFHAWHRDGTCGKEENVAVSEEHVVTARASVAWEYIQICFHWNLEQIATNSDNELDRVVRHEIAHALINEMRMWGPPLHRDDQARDEAMKHEERVATRLATILLWCRLKGGIEAKRKKGKSR
jgi:hypothetical protein